MSPLRIPRPAPVRGTVRAPGSKSVTNRALVAAAQAHGRSVIRAASFSDDSLLLVKALAELGFGVGIREERREISVEGAGGRIPRELADLWLDNAGTSLRFLTALVCLGHGIYRLDGNARMRERPIGDLVGALGALGARITHAAGCPPLRVEAAGLRGGRVSMRADKSSQFVSAILLAAPSAKAPVDLAVDGELASAPYVDTTVAVMRAFGVAVEGRFVVRPQRYAAREYDVAGDAASANYFFALAAATGGEITVTGLDPTVPQAEAAFVEVLARMGCAVRRDGDAVTVRGAPLRGVDADMNAMPDSAPTLAALALRAAGPTRIRNVATLRHKESDRLAALAQELRKFGAGVEIAPDGLTIEPPASPVAAAVESHGDHRIAMSFAVVGDVTLLEPDVVSKSYPQFFEDLRSLGAAP